MLNIIQEIRKRLGDFDYGSYEKQENIEFRPAFILENGAKYEGEW